MLIIFSFGLFCNSSFLFSMKQFNFGLLKLFPLFVTYYSDSAVVETCETSSSDRMFASSSLGDA
jgi:hypothetical protein